MTNRFSLSCILRYACILILAVVVSCSEDDDNGNNNNNGDKSKLSEFTGAWFISDEDCSNGTFNYILTISEKQSGEGDILLENLGGLGPNAEAYANINGTDFTIPSQAIPNTNGTFSGSGSINSSGTEINFSWTGGPNGNCTSSGTKQ